MLRPGCLKKPAILLIAFLVIVLASAAARADDKKEKVKWVKSKTGINSLMTLSNDRKDMIKDLEGETKNYDKIKKAIDQNTMVKGQGMDEIKRKYGEPVIEVPGKDGAPTRWSYKPSETTFFDGPKISLFFDDNSSLTGWSIYDKNHGQ
jgi:hypothetical protein